MQTEIKSLTVNFRSSKAVIRAANNLLPHQEPRSDAPEGAVTLVRYDAAAEEVASVAMQCAAIPPDQTIAVLFRTNKAADLFRSALLPFGVKLEQRPEAKGDDERLAVANVAGHVRATQRPAVLRMIELCADAGAAKAVKEYAAKTMQSVGAVMQLVDVSESAITDSHDVEQALLRGLPRKGQQSVPATKEMVAAIRWLQHLATQLPLPCTLGDLLLLATQPEPEHVRARIEVTDHSPDEGPGEKCNFSPSI